MEGDLSLSQSFGGLRITNANETPPTSPKQSAAEFTTSIPPRTSSASPSSTATERPLSAMLPSLKKDSTSSSRNRSPLGLGSIFAPNSFSKNGKAQPSQEQVSAKSSVPSTSSHRKSMPLSHQAQQQESLHSPVLSPQYQQQTIPPPSAANGRPASAFVSHSSSNLSSSSSGLANPYSDYRLTRESSRSSISGNGISGSARDGSVGMQAGVPSREGSYSDRSYRHSHMMSTGNGPMPPRRSSKGIGRGPTTEPRPGYSSSPYSLEGGPLPSSEDWKERGAAVGVRQELDRSGNPVQRYVKKGVKDFNFGRTLGEGSYSTVMAATDRQTLKEYAIKVLDKRHIIKEKKVKYVNIEKNTLNRLGDHPGIVRLYYTFQDERSLYFVLDLASNGELLGVLKRMTTFDEECTRFYGAQILDAVEYMHSRGVIHRDLKPENVLLDDQMHVKITDFGTAKILDPPRQARLDGANPANIPLAGQSQSDLLEKEQDGRAKSFVGTAEYVSPELLTNKNACKASDLWAFGCIIYQLLSGRPPFKAANEYQTFQKIVGLEYEFPNGFPPVARDLVERLLVLDPDKRLSIEHIKNHQFFDGITWGRGLWKQKAPRLKSYAPPPSEPTIIKLNGFASSPQPDIPKSNGVRPQPRVITELPPPSQLDIEWSPVLTRTNERILKLGNLMVQSSPAVHSPNSKHGHTGESGPEVPNKKFSRFFGGSTTKKRQRLVMVTSSARIILAAAGGDDKRMKTEISLLASGCSWNATSDNKGGTQWVVDTRDKHYTFEDSKGSGDASRASAAEWIDTIERAKDLAMSQNMTNSYSGDEVFNNMPSGLSSPASTLGGDAGLGLEGIGAGRSNVLKRDGGGENESGKGRKRFSKRQSRSGLAAVF